MFSAKILEAENKENPLNFQPARGFILHTPFPCGFGLILTKSVEPLHSTKRILALAGKTSSYHPGQLALEFIFLFSSIGVLGSRLFVCPCNLGILRTCFFLAVGNSGQHLKCDCHQILLKGAPNLCYRQESRQDH